MCDADGGGVLLALVAVCRRGWCWSPASLSGERAVEQKKD